MNPEEYAAIQREKLAEKQALLSPALEALIESLAQSVHDTWSQGRLNEGWVYGAVFDAEKKTTPKLIAYDQLPESEKEYDRRTARAALQGVLKQGWQIVRKTD